MKRLAFLAAAVLAVLSFAVPALAQSAKPALRLCTGRTDGVYYFAANEIGRMATSINVQPQATEGSLQNLRMLVDGQCDGAFVQHDAYRVFTQTDARAITQTERAMALYKETVHLLCNRNAKIGSITDLTSKHTVAVGPDGSGAQTTWANFVAANKDKYGPVPLDPRAGIRALNAAADGNDVTCALIVSGLGSPLLKRDGQSLGDRLVLVPIEDSKLKALKDGKNRQIYVDQEVGSDTYGSLMPSGRLWGNKALQTVGVEAIFIVNTKWIEANSSAYDSLLRSATSALPKIKERAEPK
jgi:uncharacterized protein